ncbi:MAG: DUF4410 domain-containing protein [Deltaproteobacteria bacterium]|nr:DUF4410 domain-containing protein [Deltaproteobacteria bacterium]MBW1846214.1 DUF4410 domain-containing protein [Deltaproteobacteria bacterium]MBW2179127.1 DUF4410 domain-containing protein [Deltaproteobacteria bacterium]
MNRKRAICLILTLATALFLAGCATTPDTAMDSGATFKSFKDYPDHTFNPKEYYAGMKKGGHNLLIWQDPSADLSKYKSVKITYFDGRLLPEQTEFSYSPFIKRFNLDFGQSFRIPKNDSRGLEVEGAIVECNPGSRAARAMVGLGAGKAGCGVVCEIYEPGASKPVIRIYTRDTASSGGVWGGDSVSMLNHILTVLATRLSAKIEEKVGQ